MMAAESSQRQQPSPASAPSGLLARSGRLDSLAQLANGLTVGRDSLSPSTSSDLRRASSRGDGEDGRSGMSAPASSSSTGSSARSSPRPLVRTSSPAPASNSAALLSPPPSSTATSTGPSSLTSSSHSSLGSATSRNSGFVVTSRAKQYLPPQPRSPVSGAPLELEQLELANSHRPPPSTSPPVPPFASTSSLSPPPPPPSTILHGHGHGHGHGGGALGMINYNSRHQPGAGAGASVVRKPSHSSSKSSNVGGHGHGQGAFDRTSPTPTQTNVSETNEPKTTLHLSSSIDAHGRRMVNQYVRLKTIGQGSHGKVWLCAEPVLRELDEEDERVDDDQDEEERREEDNALFDEDLIAAAARRRLKGKQARSDRWEHEIEAGNVRYCAIKSVAREGAGRGKSLRAAKGRKSSSQTSGGIGADDKVKREVAIMKRLDHPNIVRLKEVIDDVKSKKVFMVLEFMSGGQIVWQDENKRPTMTVDEARRTFRDVVLGLEYLHYQGIIHRDIKPANLLWNDDHSIVKISDFGVSHVSEALRRASPDAQQEGPARSPGAGGGGGDDDKALRKTAGSPAFFAPELCHPSDYTLTPTAGRSPSNDASASAGTYFPVDAHASPSLSSTLGSMTSPNLSPECTTMAPNGLPLTSYVISKPLPAPDPTKPRPRAPIGQGIDVWALGVTLYCLLFGDTPLMARTEYELYNVIVKESIRIPETMGVEGAWTGVGQGWEGAGDGFEGREVVDLLSRLLEKDPSKRITLQEVKKHPWVLRNLSSSPDSWLCDTDPGKTESVVITEEDVQHATQERGAVDTLPAIRNRPGIRRALSAALVRFPGFARIRRMNDAPNTPRSRSKSGSSNSQSNAEPPTRTPSHSSRHTHEEAGSAMSRKKSSIEFGMDIRRIISRETSSGGGMGRSASPATLSGRGGWGNFGRPRQASGHSNDGAGTTPSPAATQQSHVFPELARTSSTSSIGGRGLPLHLLAPGFRKASDNKSDPNGVTGTATPTSDSEVSTGSRRTLSRMLSKLGGGGSSGSNSRSSKTSSRLFGRQASISDEEAAVNGVHAISLEGALAARLENSSDRYDSLGRVIRSSIDSNSPPSVDGIPRSRRGDDDGEEEDTIDLTEFEYSESDDDDDDFLASPIAHADALSGWQGDFAPFSVDLPDGGEVHQYYESTAALDAPEEYGFRRGKHNQASFKTLDDSTPRGSAHHALSAKAFDRSEPSFDPPPLIREHSASPTRSLARLDIAAVEAKGLPRDPRDLAPVSARESSVRGSSAGPVPNSRKWDSFADAEEDDNDDEGILMAPRRRRAATVSTVSQPAPVP